MDGQVPRQAKRSPLPACVNHLARGNAELRQEQAKALRLWAADQELPIIGIGDYNFDFFKLVFLHVVTLNETASQIVQSVGE